MAASEAKAEAVSKRTLIVLILSDNAAKPETYRPERTPTKSDTTANSALVAASAATTLAALAIDVVVESSVLVTLPP